MQKLTQERLKELLCYEPDTGLFRWRVSRGGIKPKRIAGCIRDNGYRQIQVDGKDYRASRLAWLYVEGYWPEHEIDHKDRTRNNDRWKNLRHASRVCNSRNCSLSKRNKSGITGVLWESKRQRWKSEIGISSKSTTLGYFKSKFNAAKARWNAEVKYGFPNCNSTSTAYQYIQANI